MLVLMRCFCVHRLTGGRKPAPPPAGWGAVAKARNQARNTHHGIAIIHLTKYEHSTKCVCASACAASVFPLAPRRCFRSLSSFKLRSRVSAILSRPRPGCHLALRFRLRVAAPLPVRPSRVAPALLTAGSLRAAPRRRPPGDARRLRTLGRTLASSSFTDRDCRRGAPGVFKFILKVCRNSHGSQEPSRRARGRPVGGQPGPAGPGRRDPRRAALPVPVPQRAR
jgi:hypothetical protein